MRVYISGAISGTDDYIERFAVAEEVLKSAGHEVINPAKMCATLPALEWAEYMDICMAALRVCDAIYMIPGWQKSKGAQVEHMMAMGMGLEEIR